MANNTNLNEALTEAQIRMLDIVLDMIVPADTERGLPSAAELNFAGYISEYASGSIEAIHNELEALDTQAIAQHGSPFNELTEDVRETLVEKLRQEDRQFCWAIAEQTMFCYYQDERVVQALGMRPGAPFPEGNKVVSGDLLLLEPVKRRGQVYRDIN
ncbi:MAG: gluconate 2-dehydrogenase subunit 3 family protein [Pseudomonadota bacterium]